MSMKSIRTLLAAVALLALPPLAHAGPVADQPTFSEQDHAVIQRNAALRKIVGRDPWVVRKALDTIAAAAQAPERSTQSMARNTVVRGPKPKPGPNPDLDSLERSSPEAAYDLYKLIKQAGGKGRAPAR
jgi:hypothetical protein